MNKILPLILVVTLMPGCFINSVAKLKPEAEKVRLVPETEKPSECKFLGKITGNSHADDEKDAKLGAENDFRNRAAALKANFAVAENVRGGRVGTTNQREVVINGKAYECKTLDMQEAEEEKRQQAIAAKEEREEKERMAEEAKQEEEKAKREQEEKEKADKQAAEEQEKQEKKDKKKAK